MGFSYKVFDSRVGRLKLIAGDAGLAGILWENDDPKRVRISATAEEPDHPVLLEAERQLRACSPAGFRPSRFRSISRARRSKQCLAGLAGDPLWRDSDYRQIAEQIGRRTAFRAVGAANGRNPISIIAPCHRVIGSDGSLTGIADGLYAKQLQLELEGATGSAWMPFCRSLGQALGLRRVLSKLRCSFSSLPSFLPLLSPPPDGWHPPFFVLRPSSSATPSPFSPSRPMAGALPFSSFSPRPMAYAPKPHGRDEALNRVGGCKCGKRKNPQSLLTGGFVDFEIVKRTHTFLADLAATYSPKP